MDNYGRAKEYLRLFLIASVLVIGIVIITLLSGCRDVVVAQDIDLSIIAKIESSNNPLAYNWKSGARGLCQITEICLRDYNENNYTSYEEIIPGIDMMPAIKKIIRKVSIEELFDRYTNLKVADWYFNKRIPQLLKYYHLPDTIENRLRAYNSGIGTLVKGKYPNETKKYVKHYKELGGAK